MSTELLSYDYLSSMIKPYVSDLSLALVFGVGYYLFNYLQKRDDSNKKILTKEIKTKIRSKLSKWEEAKSLQVYNGLIMSNNDSKVDAFTILDKMQKNSVTPDIITYNCLIDMSFKLNHDDKALKLFEEICDGFSGVHPDIVTFNIMLKHHVSEIKELSKFRDLPNSTKLEKIFQIISDIKARDIKINEITYNTAMDACIEVGDFEKTWELFNEMKALNLKPDLYTYATLIKGLKNCGCENAFEKAMNILELVKKGEEGEIKADEVLYNSVLDICIRNNKFETAEQIFTEMKQSFHFKPSIITYSIMIRGYGLIYNIEKAFDLYEEIKSRGLKPNDIIYGCLMNCAVRCSNLDLMIEIFEKMKSLSMKPNSVIYTTLIKGFNKMKQYEKAFEIFDQLSNEERNKSSIAVFNSILDVCVESSNFHKLKQIYEELKSLAVENESYPQPNLVTYSTFIKGLIKNNNIVEAMNIYEFLKTNNYKLDEIFYSIIIDGLAASGENEKAEMIFNEMKSLQIKKSSTIYSILIKMYAKSCINYNKNDSQASTRINKDLEKAVSLISMMKEDGIKPSIITYTTLMQMYIRKKQLKEAINVFHQIKKDGLEPDQVAYNFIINGCSFNQNLENAIIFVLESLQKNVKVSDETYKNVLEYLVNNKFMKYNDRVKSATDILNGLKSRNIQINYELYSKLMRLIYKKNEIRTEKKIENNICDSFKNFSNMMKKY